MLDLKLTKDGDLELTPGGDIQPTESVCQAVRIRLLWFLNEWRLSPEMGFPYFEEVFVKNPNESKIRGLIRETVMKVDEVTSVRDVACSFDKRARRISITVVFCAGEDIYREEVELSWGSMD